MEDRLERIAVRLSPEAVDEIQAFCKAHRVSTSTLVRDALSHYFAVKSGKAFDPQRMAVLCEFTQLVADEWVRKNVPEKREEFLTAVDERLARHHGK